MLRKFICDRFPFAATFAVLLFVSGCASDKVLRRAAADCPASTDLRFEKLLGNVAGVKLTGGNSITELVNGEEFFPAMIEAVRNAKHSIQFENFVWRSGKISTRFVDALAERARAGVRVHFLVDALGAGELAEEDFRKLQHAGVIVAKYNQVTWANFYRINHRTHRKILVVDGRIGFLGGISIADDWLCQTDNPNRWRDSNYRMTGPIVAQLQKILAVNWAQTTGEFSQNEPPLLPARASGNCEAACFMSGPGEGDENARRIYLLAIASARKSIRIAHSYFLPDDFALELLLDARKRGVKVEIITPGIINYNLVRRASRSRWKKLLEAGVEFYEYQPVKYHLKLMIVDDLWVTAGSVNFDPRSFHINDEANFITRDKNFAATQIATFETDKALSRRVDPEEFLHRSRWAKTFENLASLVRFEL